jgi:hypothetical protein
VAGAGVFGAGEAVVTGASGRYLIERVPEGTASITVTATCALNAISPPVRVQASFTTDVEPAALVAGDTNGDCAIDVLDLARVTTRYRQAPPFGPCVDLNEDGVVTIADVVAVSGALGQRCPTPWRAGAAVPPALLGELRDAATADPSLGMRRGGDPARRDPPQPPPVDQARAWRLEARPSRPIYGLEVEVEAVPPLTDGGAPPFRLVSADPPPWVLDNSVDPGSRRLRLAFAITAPNPALVEGEVAHVRTTEPATLRAVSWTLVDRWGRPVEGTVELRPLALSGGRSWLPALQVSAR